MDLVLNKQYKYYDSLFKDTEINGDLFYELIGGIYCSTCNRSTSDCKCPKTNAWIRSHGTCIQCDTA